MSKRSTTGLPKTGQNKPTQTQLPMSQRPIQQRLMREYSTKAERENYIQRLVIIGTGVIIAVAVVILILSLVADQLIRPNQTVATVNGTTISVAQFEERARLERALLSEQINQGIALLSSFGLSSEEISQQISSQPPYSTYLSELSVPDQLGNRVLNEMIDDALIRQQAETLGITVTDEEVQEKVNAFFGYDPTLGVGEPTPTPSPTMTPTPIVSPTPSPEPTATQPPTNTPTPDPVTPTALPTATAVATSTPEPTLSVTERAEAFEDQRSSFYGNVRSSARVSDEAINAYFRAQAVREKVRDAVLSDLPQTDTFINARHILVAEQAEAQSAVDALNNGESFASLAAAISTDGSGANGGELGWSSPDRYVAEFADAVRDAEIGVILGPVQTQFGFHVIQVTGREERPITDDEYDAKRDTEFETYLEEAREAEGAQVEIFDIWADNVPQEPRFVPRGL